MKRFFWAISSVVICIQLVGCSPWVVRTSSLRQPRVDQEISGNRGFIFGKPTSSPKKPTFTERKVYKIEVEIPQWPQKKKPAPVKKRPAMREAKEDKVLWGNRGYIFGGPAREKVKEPTYVVPQKLQVKERPAARTKEKVSPILETKPKKIIQRRTYAVRKGDTLQKISRQFYGTTKKWPLLFKANKDKLKSPDDIYPGQVIVIPEASQFKK